MAGESIDELLRHRVVRFSLFVVAVWQQCNGWGKECSE